MTEKPKGSTPTFLLVNLLGRRATELDLLLPEVARRSAKLDVRPVFIVDFPTLELIRKQKLLYEYIPTLEMLSREVSVADALRFRRRRVQQIHRFWQPVTTIDLSATVLLGESANQHPLPRSASTYLSKSFDIVHCADLSDSEVGGYLDALIGTELRAGLRVAILHMETPNQTAATPAKNLISILRDGDVHWLSPDSVGASTNLVLFHGARTVARLPIRGTKLSAEQALVRVDENDIGGTGAPRINPDDLMANLPITGPVRQAWAASSRVVANQFVQELFAIDNIEILWPIAHQSAWEAVRPAKCSQFIAGRFAQQSIDRWPKDCDAFESAYPRRADLTLKLFGEYPSWFSKKWRQRFDNRPHRDFDEFLANIDLYVHAQKSALPGPPLSLFANALAAGVPLVVPPEWKCDLEVAAFDNSNGLSVIVDDLVNDPIRRLGLIETARSLAADRFSAHAHIGRLAALNVRKNKPNLWSSRRRAPRHIVFFSSNGIGLGHLTRSLAIARRLDRSFRPIKLTLSAAIESAAKFGILADHHMHFAYSPLADLDRSDNRRWEASITSWLNEAIALYNPGAFVFDGNWPYLGLLEARNKHQDIPFVWLRRGLWRADADPKPLERRHVFDAVIEPRELADEFDRGPTKPLQGETTIVPPITLLDPNELLPRTMARQELGLPLDATVVLLQLGSRNNFSYRDVIAAVTDRLRKEQNVVTVSLNWMISDASTLDQVDWHFKTFPAARYLRAVDFCISAAGYNAFHEIMRYRIPSIFIPNEHPSMDDQLARASWASREGAARVAQAANPYQAVRMIEELLDPSCRARILAFQSNLTVGNGAKMAARCIEMLAQNKLLDRL